MHDITDGIMGWLWHASASISSQRVELVPDPLALLSHVVVILCKQHPGGVCGDSSSEYSEAPTDARCLLINVSYMYVCTFPMRFLGQCCRLPGEQQLVTCAHMLHATAGGQVLIIVVSHTRE